ncbi:hypothetical protein FH972_004473 [Carpinus fangiana]|uniref:Uncharacterized protein n=1 Tax=Carpinus fangiana TaxID=176857 RepID=A0A5N6QLW5_9ROSI|nr:hypothetical protein FH972_004473 [Carpinus fangiana]
MGQDSQDSMERKLDRFERKMDERFDQLMSCIKELWRAPEDEDPDSSELVHREIESMELQRAPEQREKSVSFDTMDANFEESSGISQEEEATENKIMQDSQQLEKAFFARAELQETSNIGQEALFQKEEILSKARDSDDGKMNSLESLENPHVHHIPQPVASALK